MTIPFYDPQGRPKQPNYRYDSEGEQLLGLMDFIKDVEKFSYIYYTENEEFGEQLLLDNRNKINLDMLKDNATEKVGALLDIAEEELKPQDVIDLLYEAADPVPGYGIRENSFLSVPVGEMITDLHGFKGKLNTVVYDDMFKKLMEGLDQEDIDDALMKVKGHIEGEKLYQYSPYDAWQAVVDEDRFKDLLKQRLQLGEEDIIEKNPAVASTLIKALAKLVS